MARKKKVEEPERCETPAERELRYEQTLKDREELKKERGYSPVVSERYDEACERDDDFGANILMIDEMEDTMVGTMVNGHGNVVPVYERELCVKALANRYMKSGDYADYEDAYTAAVEWFEFNTERSLPYQEPYAPVIIDGFMRDADTWEEFLDEQPGD